MLQLVLHTSLPQIDILSEFDKSLLKLNTKKSYNLLYLSQF